MSKQGEHRIAFFEDLRAYESGIDPDRHDWYVAHVDIPVLYYPNVARPGRVLRDVVTGRHQLVPMTIAQYFSALGVYDLFDSGDPSCLRRMQYRAINAWGYVGYQVGEECLSDVGYYELESFSIDFPSGGARIRRFHRGGMDPQVWSNGRTEVFLANERIIVTDVNCWGGRFTGKNGVNSFEDLRQPEAQEMIIREAVASNLRKVVETLGLTGAQLHDYLARERIWAGRRVRCSLSGVIACCHLLGPQATAAFLSSSQVTCDELGTSILDYMTRFGNYSMDWAIELTN